MRRDEVTIKIFLASSIEDLREDRLQIGDFFLRLNKVYKHTGIQFDLIRCEDYDNSIAIGGKQKQYDQEIRESDLVFFLFFRKVGQYTKNEFDVALEAFKNHQKPKIVTYFKYVDSIDDVVQEVKDFMQMLDQELNHYYNTYSHIDTLKLGVLMQIKMMKLDNVDVKLEDGMVWMNDQVVARAENIPMLRGNKALWELRERYLQLVAELDRCCDVYQAEKTPKNLMALSKTSAEQETVHEQLKAVEKATLDLLADVMEMTSSGRKLSESKEKALECFNRGDYVAALEILDSEERREEFRQALEQAGRAQEKNRDIVEEQLLVIKAKKAMGDTQELAEEILERYRSVAELVEKCDLDKAVLYDYADFLHRQNRYAEAFSVAKKLEWYYSNPSIEVKEEQKAALYLLLSSMHRSTHHRQEGEAAARKALEIYTRLAEQNPAVFELELARCYGMLSALYHDTLQHEKAEEFMDKTLEIFSRLVEENPAVYGLELAQWCNLQGSHYILEQRYEKAEYALGKAFAIFSRLVERNPRAYEAELAGCCWNLGNLYHAAMCYEDAEEAYGKALEIFTRLAERNPEVYESWLAHSYLARGLLYKNTDRYENAEEALGKALEIFTRLAERNPEADENGLPVSYMELGGLCESTQRYGEAEEAYGKALEIYARLAEKNPEAYEPNLAGCYSKLGVLFWDTQRYGEAKEAYAKAEEIYTRLAEKTPEEYERILEKCRSGLKDSIILRNYSNIYQQRQKRREAYSRRDMERKARVAEQNPVNNDPMQAKRWFKNGLINATTKQYTMAEESFKQAKQLYARLAEQNPEVFEQKLADTLWNLIDVYKAQEKTEEYQASLRQAQPLFEKMARSYPSYYQEKYEFICKALKED